MKNKKEEKKKKNNFTSSLQRSEEINDKNYERRILTRANSSYNNDVLIWSCHETYLYWGNFIIQPMLYILPGITFENWSHDVMWGPDNTACSLLGNPPWLRFPLALSDCNCNCMMVSDSHNYTQLTRDNLVTERYHNSAHQLLSAKSFLPPPCIPGCLLLYRSSNCYFCHKASQHHTHRHCSNIHVCREMTED